MIAGLGISPFIMQSTESLVTITLNTGLQRYGGDLYVGSMSILMSIMQLITIPVQGITQGIQPIISYNYGAGNKERVKDTMKRMILVCLAGTLLLAGIAILAPQIYTGLFTNNQELLKLTCQVMPVYFWESLFLESSVRARHRSFTGTGKGVAVHCASQKDYSADPACNYFAKIHGGDGNLPCGANRRCNLCCDDKCCIYLYDEKKFCVICKTVVR